MKLAKKKYLHILLAALIVGSLVLFTTDNANAQFAGLGKAVAEALVGSMNKFIASSLYAVFQVIGGLVGFLAKLTSEVISIRIYTNVPIVQLGWGIVRDFANMLFIIALIVMAYGTIFDRPNLNFKALFPKFLLAAIAINFSLVICGFIIDMSQVFSNTFLNAIGTDAGTKIGHYLNPETMLPNNATMEDQVASIASLTSTIMITLIFSIFLAVTYAISLFVVVAVALVRVPMLWFLMIFSPLAWAASMFPQTRKHFSGWWHRFISWNLFLPIYLFFLYFALYFLSKKEEVIVSLGQEFINDKSFIGLIGFNFQTIFYYVMTAFLLIGGAVAAMKAGNFAGSGVTNVASWGKNTAMRLGGNIGGRYSVNALRAGANAKLNEVQKQGLPGGWSNLYGGQAALDRNAARAADMFRVGDRSAFSGQMAKEIGDKKKKFGQIQDESQLRALLNSGTDSDKLAVRELLKERGQLKGSELGETYDLYNRTNKLGAQKFAQSLNFKAMDGVQRGHWMDRVEDIETKRKVADVMAEEGDFKDFNDVSKVLNLYRQDDEKGRKDLLEKLNKKNLPLAIESRLRAGFVKNAEGDKLAWSEVSPTATDAERIKAMLENKDKIRIASKDVIGKLGKDKLDTLRESTEKILGKKPDPEMFENNVSILDNAFKGMSPREFENLLKRSNENQANAWKQAKTWWDAKEEKEKEARADMDSKINASEREIDREQMLLNEIQQDKEAREREIEMLTQIQEDSQRRVDNNKFKDEQNSQTINLRGVPPGTRPGDVPVGWQTTDSGLAVPPGAQPRRNFRLDEE